jgi:hypothetical protein
MAKQVKWLSLGLGLALLLSLLVWAIVFTRDADRRAMDPEYQWRADVAPWVWSDSQASLEYSVATYLQDYDVEVAEDRSAWNPLTIRIRTKDGGREVYTWQGHQGTVFARSGHTLFIADFWPNVAYCTVVAIDLHTGQRLWNTPLKAAGCPGHSRYRNQVNLETDGKVVTVRGNESHGRYIEFVDCLTGKTVGHKKYDR